jgi:hypothetical protein
VLPFLKRKQAASSGVIIKTREPDKTSEESTEQSIDSSAIESCARDLISAVHAQDAKGVAEAIKTAFDILESMPHEEMSEGPSPHSYEAQNIKASEEG